MPSCSFIILLIFFFSTGCSFTSEKPIITVKKNSTKIDSSKLQIELTNNQKRILSGAKTNLQENASYDLTMGYYVLEYEDGKFKNKKIYPGGDLDPSTGVCTDVIIRSLRNAGIVDLQKAIHEDVIAHKKDYPVSRWNNKKPDPNIDHRRVINLEVWFAKYWDEPGADNYLPGDVIVWDMNEDGISDHTGILSDVKVGENYSVIHNHPDPGHIADEDKLFKWKISGHYRIKD
ncbi:MAG: DUF1287 domain-containing protein [bacterium]